MFCLKATLQSQDQWQDTYLGDGKCKHGSMIKTKTEEQILPKVVRDLNFDVLEVNFLIIYFRFDKIFILPTEL